MKHSTRRIVLLLLAFLPSVAAEPRAAQAGGLPKKAKLFILAGQSNAGGKGVGSDLPDELRKPHPEVLMIGRRARTLTPVAPYKRRGFGTDDTAFGPEVVFARRMKQAFPDWTICIAKQTTGGCSIIAWDKNWKRPGWVEQMRQVGNEQKGPQYDRLIQTVRDAVAALKEKGIERIDHAGMLWVQSERDDEAEAAARAYGKNLAALIANVRRDLDAPEMPFLFVDANVRRWGDVIRAGMRRVVDEVPRAAIIRNDDLPKVDAAHYNTEGQIMLGARFAEAYLEMLGRPPDECRSGEGGHRGG